MKQRGQRIEQRCPTCLTSDRKHCGMLWLGGTDYMTCPDCNGTTRFVMWEIIVVPGKSFRADGFKQMGSVVTYAPGPVLMPSRDIKKEIEIEAR